MSYLLKKAHRLCKSEEEVNENIEDIYEIVPLHKIINTNEDKQIHDWQNYKIFADFVPKRIQCKTELLWGNWSFAQGIQLVWKPLQVWNLPKGKSNGRHIKEPIVGFEDVDRLLWGTATKKHEP